MERKSQHHFAAGHQRHWADERGLVHVIAMDQPAPLDSVAVDALKGRLASPRSTACLDHQYSVGEPADTSFETKLEKIDRRGIEAIRWAVGRGGRSSTGRSQDAARAVSMEHALARYVAYQLARGPKARRSFEKWHGVNAGQPTANGQSKYIKWITDEAERLAPELFSRRWRRRTGRVGADMLIASDEPVGWRSEGGGTTLGEANLIVLPVDRRHLVAYSRKDAVPAAWSGDLTAGQANYLVALSSALLIAHPSQTEIPFIGEDGGERSISLRVPDRQGIRIAVADDRKTGEISSA